MDDLEQKIDKAEKKLLRAKKQYDTAIEELHKLLEERDALCHGLDSGQITLKQFSFEWDGDAVWDCGSGAVDCFFTVKAELGESEEGVRGKEVRGTIELALRSYSRETYLCPVLKYTQRGSAAVKDKARRSYLLTSHPVVGISI